MPQIEDVFDDDTDIPLPNVPLPNSGRGPLLQSVDDGFYSSPSSTYNPGAPSRPAPDPSFQMPPGMGNADLASLFAAAQRPDANIDTSKYKNWTCVYPIYLSARAPASVRRLPQRRCVKWPLSKDITTACSSLGLPVMHESLKKHPRDWENPGRVRVQLKDEKGRLLNSMVPSKGVLLMLIAQRLQTMDPENVWKPEEKPKEEIPSPTKAKGKGKAVARTYPSTFPPAGKVSVMSPAIQTGQLVEAVTAGMAAAEKAEKEQAQQAQQNPMLAAAAGKGKKKVIRVRQ